MADQKFGVELSVELQVQFDDPVKAEKYFCQDGEFRESFWQWDDLKEAAGELAFAFDGESSWYDSDRDTHTRELEGVGIFAETARGDQWLCEDHDTHGGIRIEYIYEIAVNNVQPK